LAGGDEDYRNQVMLLLLLAWFEIGEKFPGVLLPNSCKVRNPKKYFQE
jgi:hypothetical protein